MKTLPGSARHRPRSTVLPCAVPETVKAIVSPEEPRLMLGPSQYIFSFGLLDLKVVIQVNLVSICFKVSNPPVYFFLFLFLALSVVRYCVGEGEVKKGHFITVRCLVFEVSRKLHKTRPYCRSHIKKFLSSEPAKRETGLFVVDTETARARI